MILRVKNDGTTAMTLYAKQQRAIDAGLEKEFCDPKLFPKDDSCPTKLGTAEFAAPIASPSRSAS